MRFRERGSGETPQGMLRGLVEVIQVVPATWCGRGGSGMRGSRGSRGYGFRSSCDSEVCGLDGILLFLVHGICDSFFFQILRASSYLSFLSDSSCLPYLVHGASTCLPFVVLNASGYLLFLLHGANSS